jgi:hypothetical protein
MKISSGEMENKKALIQAIVDRMKTVVGVSKDVDLAEAIGVSRTQPSIWKIRDRVPLPECLAMAEKYEVSLDWLVLGRGQSVLDETRTKPDCSKGALFGDPMYVEIPAFDLPGYVNGESCQQWFRAPRAWIESDGLQDGEWFALRVVGETANNMSPTISGGDVLFIDRRPRDVDGVYVVRISDAVRLRRVQRLHSGTVHLISDNQAYPTEIVEADQAATVEFIGYCFRQLRPVS